MQYNFNNLKKIEITNKHIVNFLSTPILTTCFNHGWIGGGFAREVASIILDRQELELFDRLQNFKSKRESPFLDYFNTRKGDIDFFFQDKSRASLAVACLNKSPGHLPTTTAAFAKNFYMNTYRNSDPVKIQIVTEFSYESVKNMFESFDFINSCYAIVSHPSDKTKFYLVCHPRAWECDSKKMLEVKKSNSPYTLQRIKKYLTYRNLNYISKESQEELENILIRGACDAYEKKFAWNPLGNYIESCIRWLFKTGYIVPEKAILFLGKYQLKQYSNYGPTIIKDWAVNHLQEQKERMKVSF